MGYFKNQEIENQTEEGDRVLAPGRVKKHRRETYVAPKRVVVRNSDTFAILALPLLGIAIGVLIGLAAG
jgi:hypothetical protein